MVQLVSCTVYRHVPDGSQLVTKVKIKGAPGSQKSDLAGLVEEKPNSKIFGIWRLRTRNWYFTKKWREKKGKESTIWEAPSYFSTEATTSTVEKMEAYLRNQGYFNVEVQGSAKLKGWRKRKAVVIYRINEGKVYKIDEISRNIEDYYIYLLMEEDKPNSLVESKTNFSTKLLVEERERLTQLIKSKGYYDFGREYIYFDLDSAFNTQKINVDIGIKNPGRFMRHKVYRIGSIEFSNRNDPDTTMVLIGKNTYRRGEGNKYIDDLMEGSLTIGSGELYNPTRIEESLRNLRKLSKYQYVDLLFYKDSIDSDTALLNLKFVLTKNTRFQLQGQLEAITSEQSGEGRTFNGRLYGLAGSITFRDRDFSKRGIQMETTMRGATEISLADYPSLAANNQIGLSNSYYFARPFLARLIPDPILTMMSRSTLSLNGFVESNPDFRRSTFNVSAGYTIETKKLKHYLLPIDFYLISTNVLSQGFQTLLDTSQNLFLANLFDNHSIPGSRWAIYYSNKTKSNHRNYLEVIGNVLELSGNLFYLTSRLLGKKVEGDLANTYENTLLGMHFFQYVKADYDVRWHYQTFWNDELVCRMYTGMIYPIGNTPTAVPFEKRYYGGGSNGIRGWGVRTLGPGSYRPLDADDSYIYFHSGDIKLEANIEYRFSISNVLKMAVFADAGNIWNHPSNNFQVEGGDWQWNRFYKEFAVAGGIGLRWDFNYFIFRTDLGIPMRDPAALGEGGDKWFPAERFNWNSLGNAYRFNFGIGYPF